MSDTYILKENPNRLKDFFSSAIVVILGALITGWIAHNYQIGEDNEAKEKTAYERMTNSIEKYTKNTGYMIFLMRSMDEIHFEVVKTKFEQGKDSSLKKLLVDSLGVEIPFDEGQEILKGLKKKFPLDYDRYTEASKFFSDYQSAYFSTRNQFFGNTRKLMESLNNTLTPRYYKDMVLKLHKIEIKPGKRIVLHVDEGRLDNALLNERTKLFEAVTESIEFDIKSCTLKTKKIKWFGLF